MFAGLLSLLPAPAAAQTVDSSAISAALSPFHRPDLEGLWQSPRLWLMVQRVDNAAASRDTQLPCRCAETGVVLAFWGRLDNRAELAARLDLPPDTLQTLTDSQLVMAAWHRWQESLPEQLLGDFALAVADPLRHRVFLARDAFGVKPLYYVLNAGLLAFATTAAALRRIEPLTLTPDPEWMARYLAGISMSREATAYREIVKLPPGHCLTVDASGRERLRRWFRLRDDPPAARRRDPLWVQAYRALLEQAIRCRMSSEYPLGTENSGGIDSAAITAYLARFLGEPGDRLHSFGYAMCELEPAYILATSQASRIVHNYLITASLATEQGEQDRIQRELSVLGYPEEHGMGSSGMPFYRECALRGIRTLFSGFGGDEVVSHNEGQQLRLELLDHHHYRPLWNILPGNLLTRGLRLGKLLATSRRRPEYNPGFLHAWNARWPQQLLRAEVVKRWGIHQAYMETARYDAPYRRGNDFILRELVDAPYVACRFEACTLMAASYGVEYRWPLWDTRLVQQYLSTPGLEKTGPRGVQRYLHRRAIDGVVPALVTWKLTKNMSPARGSQEFADNDLRRWVEMARAQEAGLHPALDELIDRDKFRQEIENAKKDGLDSETAATFMRNAGAVQQLNHWLHGSDAG